MTVGHRCVQKAGVRCINQVGLLGLTQISTSLLSRRCGLVAYSSWSGIIRGYDNGQRRLWVLPVVIYDDYST